MSPAAAFAPRRQDEQRRMVAADAAESAGLRISAVRRFPEEGGHSPLRAPRSSFPLPPAVLRTAIPASGGARVLV